MFTVFFHFIFLTLILVSDIVFCSLHLIVVGRWMFTFDSILLWQSTFERARIMLVAYR